MSGNSGETLEEATISEESQANFARSFVDFLKQHRAELPTLPEMFERLIDMESNDNSDTQNSRREDEQPISEKRKIAELQRRYKKKLAEKDERIGQLENELEGKKKELEKFDRLKEQCEGASSKKDQDLKEVNISTFCSYDDLKELVSSKDDQVKTFAARNEELTQQIRIKEEQVKECVAKYNELTEECKVMLTNKDEELKGIQARHSEFKEKCKVHVERKDEELKQMKTRLACLSEKQAQKDQRKVEDTTSSNRPSEVEKDFAAFFDDDRMDACEKMQLVYGSEEESEVGISYPRLACMIFETAYEEVKETKEAVLTLFKVITKNMIDLAPTKGVEYVSNTKSARLPYYLSFSVIPYRPEMEYPVDVFDALVLSLKETAHKCDLTSLEQDVTRKVKEKWLQWLTNETSCRFSFSEHLLTQLSAYINACIRLTWRMVTQVPPMQLEYQSTTLKDIHKNVGYHSGPEMSSRRPTTEGQSSDEELEIACYLWPALLDGGRKLIRVGEVVCKVKGDQ